MPTMPAPKAGKPSDVPQVPGAQFIPDSVSRDNEDNLFERFLNHFRNSTRSRLLRPRPETTYEKFVRDSSFSRPAPVKNAVLLAAFIAAHTMPAPAGQGEAEQVAAVNMSDLWNTDP